jgi:hypothetical protein
MPIIEVTMYRAVCDICGKGEDSEYWAWADDGQARDEWTDGDDLALRDGRVYHRECLPVDVCPADDDGVHHWLDEDDGDECECGAEKPSVAEASRG